METKSTNGKQIIKPRAVSGFADYTEAENYSLALWLQIVQATFSLFGFSKLIPRPLELREVLTAKGGIQKQIFGVSRLPADTKTDLALPFDRTVPLAVWVARHASEIDFPYKRYDIGYSFRGERPQQGRFLAFLQCDVDIIGYKSLSLNADAECINVLFTAITRLQIGVAYINLNNIKLSNAILTAYEVVDEECRRQVLNIIDDIPKVTLEITFKSLLGIISDDKAQVFLKIFSYKGSLQEFLAGTKCIETTEIQTAIEELLWVQNALLKAGLPTDRIVFRPCIVRGLDYYNGIVFETFIRGFEHFGSVASGGRYEDLASTFTNERLPGVGGSIGLTRLFDLALKNNSVKLNRKTEAEFIVCYKDETLLDDATMIATAIRALGHNTDVYSGGGNIKKQLKYTDKKGIPNAIMVMGASHIICKDLTTSTQVEFKSLNSLINYIKFANHGKESN